MDEPLHIPSARKDYFIPGERRHFPQDVLSQLRSVLDLSSSLNRALEDRFPQDTFVAWVLEVLRRDSELAAVPFIDDDARKELRSAPICSSSSSEALDDGHSLSLFHGLEERLPALERRYREDRREDALMCIPKLVQASSRQAAPGQPQKKAKLKTQPRQESSLRAQGGRRTALCSPGPAKASSKGWKSGSGHQGKGKYSQTLYFPRPTLPRDTPLPPSSHVSSPVGARLSSFWTVWRDLGASPWSVLVLRKGFAFRFKHLPPLSPVPLPFRLPVSQTRLVELDSQIAKMISKQAVEPADPRSPGFYSRIFVVPKATGGWRPVIDLSALNRFLVIPKFSMETAESIRLSMPQGAWVVSLDLKDAYFHIPVRKGLRKYLRFAYKGKVWQFRALPFGLSPAPWVFTMAVRELQVLAHRQGIFLHQYLDDWVIRHQSREVLERQRDYVLSLCESMGFMINPEKSELTPAQSFVFVGYQFHTDKAVVTPSQDRVQKIRVRAAPFLQGGPQTARRWQSLLGLLSSTEKLVPMGRVHMRELQFDLKSQWSQASGLPGDLVSLSPRARQDLLWWTRDANLLRGSPFQSPPASKHLFTDASTEGWGAHLDFQEISGRWSSAERLVHINRLELQAVALALIHWQDQCKGHVVLVATDNSTVVSYINKQGGTQSLSLSRQASWLLGWCADRRITLRARHIPGHLNVLADALSREGQVLPSEWSLSPRVFKALESLWGPHHIDLFATRWNCKVPTFVSPIPDDRAWGVDALSLPWEGFMAYAYPPSGVLAKVLTKIRSHECQVTLIAPAWTDKSWFPELLDLLIDFPRELPSHWDLLKQPRRPLFHQAPQALRLHAWRLSNSPCEREAFLERCQFASQDQLDGLLWTSTSLSGQSSSLGVVAGRLIHSLPLLP